MLDGTIENTLIKKVNGVMHSSNHFFFNDWWVTNMNIVSYLYLVKFACE